MTNVVADNLDLLSQRWPALAAEVANAPLPELYSFNEQGRQTTLEIKGQRLWSAFDPEAEAELQALDIPVDADAAWVYGVGGGDVIRALVKRRRLRSIKVCPLNLGVFGLLLHTVDCRDWLADERVMLVDARTQRSINFPFVTIPACLQLADDACVFLRDRLMLERDAEFLGEKRRWRESIYKQQIKENEQCLQQDPDVFQLIKALDAKRVYVVAAGPSLLQTRHGLREHRQRGLVIVVDAALQPCLEVGLVPDVVVTIDDKPVIARFFDTDLSACKHVPLVYFPQVIHSVLASWPGPRYAALSNSWLFDDLRRRYPKHALASYGSVIHPAVDLAVQSGATEVVFAGADFGFSGTRKHANQLAGINENIDFYSGKTQLENGHGEAITTLPNFRGYLRDLEDYIQSHPGVRFMNSSRAGARILGTTYLDF